MINLKSILFSLIILLSATFGSQIEAKTISLAELSRSDSDEVTKLYLMVNHNGIIKRLKIKNTDGTKFLKPKDLKGKGFTVLKKMGVKVLVLKSDNFDVKLGGIITVDYLKKYRFMRKDIRGSKEIELVQNDAGKWQLLNEGKPFKKIIFQVGDKGIKKVTFK